MVHDAEANRAAKRWLWLLIIPWIAMVWVPSYNKVEPQLWGFPFFYWYQLFWVLMSAVITALVYMKTKSASKSGTGRGGAQ